MTRLEPTPQADRNLDKLLSRIDEVSTLPHVMMQVTAVTNNPLSSVEDLSRVVETDPALATRLLRRVNSAKYGLSQRVKDLKKAVGYLGFSEVRNIAVASSVCNIFRKDLKVGPYDRRRLWDHLVSTAVTARIVALLQKLDNPEEAFLAGLLHDLGIILEDQYDHDRFVEMMQNFPADRPLIEVEQKYFGFDHTLLGFRVAQKWNMPESVQHAIRLHHQPEYDGPHAKIIACVELANVMCSLRGVQSLGMVDVKLSPSVQKHLGLDVGQIKTLVGDMNYHLAKHEQLFNLPDE